MGQKQIFMVNFNKKFITFMALRPLILFLQIYLCVQWCLKQTYFDLTDSDIQQVDWSPDGNYIAVASAITNRVSVISFSTSNVVWFRTFSNMVTTAKFSHDGKFLAVGQANDDTINIYNVPAFTFRNSFRAEHGNSETVYELDWNSDDSKMLTCASDGKVNQRVLSDGSYDFKKSIDTSNNVITCKYSSSDRVGMATDTGRMIVLKSDYSIDANQSKNLVKDVDFKSGSSWLYGGCTCDKSVWQLDTGSSGSFNNYFNPNKDQIWTISFAPDSTFLAAGGKAGHTYIIDITTGTRSLEAYWQQDTIDINSVRVSDDSNYVAVANTNGTIRIYARHCSTCPVGFYVNQTSCKMCSMEIIGCATCANSSYCHTCHPSYYRDSNNVCKLCDYSLDGCSTCKSSSVCYTCVQTYYLSGNTCRKCNMTTSNCEQCMNNGTCIKCSYYTYLTTSGTCSLCKNSIANCLNCYQHENSTSATNSTLYCTRCAQGYYASTTACLPCPANCLQCFSNGDCTACNQQYRLNGTACTTRCPNYCQSCLQSGTCLECLPTTYLVNNSCTVCTFPCLTCVTTATTCRSCSPGYYYVSASSTCARCVGCPLCNPITGACLACPWGQYLQSPGNTCAYCLNVTSHCQICTASVCIACERNYYLSASNTCLVASSFSNCDIYLKNSTTICQHCALGFYLDSSNSSCVSCLKQCSVCDNSNNCTQCQLGFYIVAANATCLPCANDCRTCGSATQCLSCGDQYYLVNSTCRKCWLQIPYCNSCLNSTHCLDCYLGYQLASDSLSCTQCVSPCATCSSAGCLSCEQGYFYTPNSCTRCAAGCAECTSSGVCQACVSGYTLDGSNACVRCSTIFPDCEYCSYTGCLTCRQYFMLNSTSGSCTACPNNITNCLSCDNTGICKSCRTGFYPASNKLSCINCAVTMPYCQKCVNGTTCDECQTGFYASAANTCSPCINGCLICSAAAVCDICQTGFIKVSNVCKECSEHVFGCQMCTVAGGCSNCLIGYYRASSTSCLLCKSAMEGCTACSSNTLCLSCDAGYFKNGTNKCQKCSSTAGCGVCSSAGNCAQCLSGYFMNGTTCQLCSSAFPSCGICNASQCVRCDSGSHLSNGSCLSCTTTYGPSCILCNTTKCLQCESGNYLDSNGTCQLCGITGCQLCSPTGTTCLSCQNMYYNTGSSCSTCDSMDIGCISCNGLNNCILCKTGYYLQANGTCRLCELKFPACDVCSLSRCQDCQSNYYHNSSATTGDCILCSRFLPGCALCINQAECLNCEAGYYLSNLQCHSCTTINQCMICRDNTTCLFCGAGYYLDAGQCLSCSAAIPGCFSCISSSVCSTCSGSFALTGGSCVQVKGVVPQNYTQVRIVSEYVNGTHLKHTLYASKIQFKKVQQKWAQVTKIQLVLPPYNKTALTILKVEWGPLGSSSLIFYTNNPLGQISSAKSSKNLPMIKFIRRALLTLDELNMQINFNMQRAAIQQILPQLKTNGQDLAVQYKLDNPQFYRSIVKQERYNYYLFGIAITSILLFMYFVKICCVLPMTEDAGQIIPHVLLMKIPAMVIYPTLGGYISYCYGFTFLDFPWLNNYFSSILSISSDKSPPSFQMFYNNLNLSSTYLLALIVFLALYVPIKIYSTYKQCKKSPVKKIAERKTNNFNDTRQSISVLDKPTDRLQIFSSYIYNIFIAGITVSSCACMIGMAYNPSSYISGQGAFYILGILIYTIILLDAIKSFTESKAKFNKIRVVIKGTLMTFIYWSPVPLFAAMAFIDAAIMLLEYRIKVKQWVVPRIWLLNHSLCLISYGALIFLSNMLIGIIVASLCTVLLLGLDGYLQYAEHLEVEKIKDLRSRSRDYTQNNLSIEGFIPDKKQIMQSRANDLFFEENAESKKLQKSELYNRTSVRVHREKAQGKTKPQFNAFQASSMNLSNLSNFQTSQEKNSQETRKTFTIKGLNK